MQGVRSDGKSQRIGGGVQGVLQGLAFRIQRIQNVFGALGVGRIGVQGADAGVHRTEIDDVHGGGSKQRGGRTFVVQRQRGGRIRRGGRLQRIRRGIRLQGIRRNTRLQRIRRNTRLQRIRRNTRL